jgi:hypothetical protein
VSKIRLRSGVDPVLEAEADELIKNSFLEHPDKTEKAKILTIWMLTARLSREIYVTDGVPDGSLRRGTFHRSLNPKYPHLNGADATAFRPRRFPTTGADTWDA